MESMALHGTLARSVGMYLVATVFFVALDSLAKTMVTSLPLPFVVWGRYAGGLCLLVLLLPFVGGRTVLFTRHGGVQFARGGVLMGATACMFAAVGSLPVAESYAISYLSPMIVVLLAALWLKERVTTAQMLGILLGFIGVLIIIRPGFHAWRWAMLLPAGSAFFYALYQVMTRLVGQHDQPITSLFYVTLAGTLLASLALPWSYTTMPLLSWAVLGMMGALGTIGHFLLIKAYQSAGATVLAPLVYVQIIWAALIDYFIFGTSLAPLVLVGAGIVIGAGLLIIKGAQVPPQHGQRETK
jgi:drug/metabolite transporter (DMT)-like permease